MKHILISLPEEEFWLKMEKLLDSRIEKLIMEKEPISMKTYSFNQVSKLMHRKHETIKKLVYAGVINTTPDGRITEEALNKYMKENS